MSRWGLAGLNNAGPHGLSEILYAFSSGSGQQRQRVRRPERQHALVQHHAGAGHADRPLSHDRADHGDGGIAGAEEARPSEHGHFSRLGRHVRRAPDRHRSADRRAELPSGADAGAGRGALPHGSKGGCSDAGDPMHSELPPRCSTGGLLRPAIADCVPQARSAA